MIDTQSEVDDRRVDIAEVGLSDLRYPITVVDRSGARQSTVALLQLSVALPHHCRGTHMSRFTQVLNEHRGDYHLDAIAAILARLKLRLEAHAARIDVRFPYFAERAAPVSGVKGLMDYEAWFQGSTGPSGDDLLVGARVPVTALCPCSKAISDYGAHNQRGYITLEAKPVLDGSGRARALAIEELIELAESAGSAPVYPLLKRDDERHVTMQAYDNPVFVEDMIRTVALKLRADARVRWFRVHVVNHESIHNHGAFARLEWERT